MQEIMENLYDSMKKLNSCIAKRYEVSENRANAEYAYRSELGREMAQHKMDGMAATALYNYCRSLEKVAKLRSERDILIAQEDYLTEMIFYHRQAIKIYSSEAETERRGM